MAPADPSTGPDGIDRRFLQRRLAAFGRITFLFLVSYLVVFNVVNVLNPAYTWRQWLLNSSNHLHLAAAFVMGTVWLFCRTGERSRVVLLALDAGGLWLAGLAFAASVWVADPEGSRNHHMLLEITNMVLARSVIVPSSGRRTFWTCFALVPLATQAAYVFDVRRGLPFLDVVRHSAEAFVSCSIAVGVATLASMVIFGLRARVLEAQTFGQYTLVEKVGEGGMGVVYRATHAMLRRPTAVKLLPPEKSGEEERRRFEHEVQLTSRLTHPNTVAIYDYGRTRGGVFYYAMEFLDGLNLEQLVRRFGPPPPARAVHILKHLCASLAEAHESGLVHRDVKPANLILCERWGAADVLKVVDFGLVRGFKASAEDSAEKSSAIGTPLHMSPESIHSPGDVEPRSDLYAVGTVAYYLLTGHNVFDGPSVTEILAHHLLTPPIPPSKRGAVGVPAALDALIMTCLSKAVADRPPSALALQEALGSCEGVAVWTQEEAKAWWALYRRSPTPDRDEREIGTATEIARLDVILRGRVARSEHNL